MTELIETKGIILGSFPQGEYGKRLSVLTDRFGRITVFAQGAAKQSSHLIGALRPMTGGTLSLARGRNAWTVRGISVIDSFDELSFDPELCFYAAYFMELASYMTDEGMDEREARNVLNLLFVSFDALRRKELDPQLIRSVFELRLMVFQGEYTEDPGNGGSAECAGMWRYAALAPLSRLFDSGVYPDSEDAAAEFGAAVSGLVKRQVDHSFRSLQILREI